MLLSERVARAGGDDNTTLRPLARKWQMVGLLGTRLLLFSHPSHPSPRCFYIILLLAFFLIPKWERSEGEFLRLSPPFWTAILACLALSSASPGLVHQHWISQPYPLSPHVMGRRGRSPHVPPASRIQSNAPRRSVLRRMPKRTEMNNFRSNFKQRARSTLP